MTNHPNRSPVTRAQVEALADKLGLAFGRQRVRVIENGHEAALMMWYAVPKQGECGFDPEHYGYKARTLVQLHDLLSDRLYEAEQSRLAWGEIKQHSVSP